MDQPTITQFECDSLKAEKKFTNHTNLIIAGLAGWTFEQCFQSCVVADHTWLEFRAGFQE
jgi:hypothetical protein